MENTLVQTRWLAGEHFTLADIAMAPYLNRLAALAMNEVWEQGRLPRVADWLSRIQERETYQTSIRDWVPAALREEMYTNGLKTWPQIKQLLQEQ
jgi:glutathione S-transferase